MESTWDHAFDNELRKHLKLLPQEQALAPDAGLVDLGLDSLGVVSLLVQLESLYQISFPDSAMTFETFASPATLWAAVARLQGGASQ